MRRGSPQIATDYGRSVTAVALGVWLIAAHKQTSTVDLTDDTHRRFGQPPKASAAAAPRAGSTPVRSAWPVDER